MKLKNYILLILSLSTTQGLAQFQDEIILYSGNNAVHDVYAADVNQDGLSDIIGATQGELILFKNNGAHNYTEVVLEYREDAEFYASHTADVDGDGQLDIITATNGDGHIAWYKNLGGATFSTEILVFEADHARDVFAEDMDNDGDIDLLVSSGPISSDYSDQISWFENDGVGNFAPQQILSTDVSRGDCVYPFDIDNDGDMDVFATSLIGDKVIWMENLGNGNFSASMVANEDAVGAQSLFIEDLNNDGSWDIFTANRNAIERLVYTTYLGNGIFASPIEVPVLSGQPPCIFPGDFDNDGLFDIAIVDDQFGHVGFNRNLGNGDFQPVELKDGAAGASAVFAADLDIDGDLELIYSEEDGKSISYFINSTLTSTTTSFVESTGLVFPNPTSGELGITVTEYDFANLMDDSGKILLHLKKQEGKLDITHLPSGVYFIQFYSENHYTTQKIIKK